MRAVADTPSSNRYLIQNAVGEGGAGSVFAAWDQQLSRHVAIKRIKEDADIEASIRREAGILAALHHPNIVSIFDFASDDEGAFVVMELVNGQTLDAIASAQPLQIPVFLEMVTQVCQGLSAAHSRGLVHRDLKPGNMMFQHHADGSFTVKILDFGLATMQEDEIEEAAEDGTIFGSAYTIAPEQLTRKTIDARTDIYALGCIFYFALSGHYPYEADDVQDILRGHMYGQPKSLHLLQPSVPEPLARMISKMLSRDPDARPQSAEEVRKALHAAARAPSYHKTGVLETPSYQVPGVATAPRSASLAPPRRKIPWGAIATIAMVAAGIGIWFRPKPAPSPVVVIESAPSPSPGIIYPPLDPLDEQAVEKSAGTIVTVEAVVKSVSESALFHSHVLKFSETSPRALAIALPNAKFSAEKARAFLHKRIKATGTVVNQAGNYRLSVESSADIAEADEPPKKK